MSTIKYQFGQIEAAASDIRSTSTRINAELSDLKSTLRPMVETWEGDSATAYNAAQAQWDQAAAELNIVLEQIAQALSQGNDNMADINRRAAASWQ